MPTAFSGQLPIPYCSCFLTLLDHLLLSSVVQNQFSSKCILLSCLRCCDNGTVCVHRASMWYDHLVTGVVTQQLICDAADRNGVHLNKD